MTRGLWLVIAVLVCTAQKGDAPPVRIKAFVCEASGRDLCGKRVRSGFEPARIRLEAYMTAMPGATDMQYGLLCDGEDEPRARSIVDLSGPNVGPMYFVEHRGVEAGICYGVAVVYRRDGKPITARSEPVLILSRD